MSLTSCRVRNLTSVNLVLLFRNGPKWVLQVQLKTCLSLYGFRPRNICVKSMNGHQEPWLKMGHTLVGSLPHTWKLVGTSYWTGQVCLVDMSWNTDKGHPVQWHQVSLSGICLSLRFFCFSLRSRSVILTPVEEASELKTVEQASVILRPGNTVFVQFLQGEPSYQYPRMWNVWVIVCTV